MPTSKIHVHEGRYDEPRLAKLGEVIQSALEAGLDPRSSRSISIPCI